MNKVKVMEKPTEIVLFNPQVFMPPVESARDREWHNRENREQALESYRCMVHSEENNLPSQYELHKEDVRAHLDKDRAEEAIFKAKVQDIYSKLFAVHEFRDQPEPFSVKSKKFDWQVLPIEMTRERVPLFALERATMLKRNGVVPDFYALAVPGKANFNPTSYVVKQETKKTLKDVGRLSVQTAKLTLRAGKKAGKAALVAGSAVGTTVASVMPSREAWDAFFKDPVLLACFGLRPCFLVEIGRWD